MKELRGTATAAVAIPIEDAFALIAAVDRYPTWYPDVVRKVEVVERNSDGRPTKARTTLHVSHGPLVRDFNLLLAVDVERPVTVRLKRLAHDRSDTELFEVTWRLREGVDTRIDLELDATLSVPRFLPLGGVGDAMAQGFVTAARTALSRVRG